MNYINKIIEKLQPLYKAHHLVIENIVQEAESSDYQAYQFTINHKRIIFRVSKITPTKIGQFATLWKRVNNGPIMPFDISDSIDYFMVVCCTDTQFGVFIFPKKVLLEQGYLSRDGQGGKRAMRVYPPWDNSDNKAAQRTQTWQLQHFFDANNYEVEKLFI